ncbi:hypothetical protein L1987_76747 [Smallanthus sonchifolius]|uniref:Uncharacterized protein n=1 Tax=Smallanthus sonchifolius TaxID=185202 RepID=A0ACB8Z937_9ASTR|nr:hypothetical protein L1987_76747 [Smallanthus sonchifolius]
MANSRGFAVSRSDSSDHTGSYSNVNPDLNQVLQQQLLRANNHRNQLDVMAVTDVNNRSESDCFNAALFMPPFLTSSSLPGTSRPPNSVTNLNSFLESVTPVVPAQKPSETDLKKEAEIHPYYCIGDLWESFQEWSAYGAGVPFLLNGRHRTTQYYVPFLSGMQLYIDPKKPKIGSLAEENAVKSNEPNQQTNLVSDGSFASLNLNNQKLKQVLLTDNKTDVCGSRGTLAFEYMEQDRPHTRKPLSEKASVLGSQFPELNQYRSCDLSPSSWICVAWYPIYRIPVGTTLEDLEASFLTLHALSTQRGSNNEAESSYRNARGVHAELDLSSMVRLPVFGLASYS